MLPLFGRSFSEKPPLLTGFVVLLSVLLAAGLGSPLSALAAGPPIEYVVNGGFETGDFSGWSVTESGLFPVVQGDQVSEGQYAAHMGDGGEGMIPSEPPPPETAAIAQEISLPAGVENPLLKLAYLVEFEEGYDDYEFGGDEYSWLEVLIDDQQVLYACSHSDGWQEHEYDLSEYIGKTFTLTVRTVLDVAAMYNWLEENDAFTIDFYVDDISVTALGVEEEETEPEEPQEPEEELPQTGGTLPLAGLPALGLISGGAALLGLRRKLSR